MHQKMIYILIFKTNLNNTMAHHPHEYLSEIPKP